MTNYENLKKRSTMTNKELLEDELKELESIHARLDNAIDEGYSNYLGDPSLVKMKQERLVIKRSIESIKQQLVNK